MCFLIVFLVENDDYLNFSVWCFWLNRKFNVRFFAHSIFCPLDSFVPSLLFFVLYYLPFFLLIRRFLARKYQLLLDQPLEAGRHRVLQPKQHSLRKPKRLHSLHRPIWIMVRWRSHLWLIVGCCWVLCRIVFVGIVLLARLRVQTGPRKTRLTQLSTWGWLSNSIRPKPKPRPNNYSGKTWHSSAVGRWFELEFVV